MIPIDKLSRLIIANVLLRHMILKAICRYCLNIRLSLLIIDVNICFLLKEKQFCRSMIMQSVILNHCEKSIAQNNPNNTDYLVE